MCDFPLGIVITVVRGTNPHRESGRSGPIIPPKGQFAFKKKNANIPLNKERSGQMEPKSGF